MPGAPPRASADQQPAAARERARDAWQFARGRDADALADRAYSTTISAPQEQSVAAAVPLRGYLLMFSSTITGACPGLVGIVEHDGGENDADRANDGLPVMAVERTVYRAHQ